MERAEYIKVCKKCKNRKFNRAIGIICGLTESVADFKSHCDSFVLDKKVGDKEREFYHPKNFRKKDRNTGSRQVKKKLNIFNINPNCKELIIEKRKVDQFTYYGLFALLATFVYTFSKNPDFHEDMQKPINLVVWILLLSYPVIRYIFPFPKYRFTEKGIVKRNGDTISWADIQSITLTEHIDEEDNISYDQKFYFRLKEGYVKKINFNNYIISNDSVDIQKADFELYSINKREIIESIIVSYYDRFGKIAKKTNRGY